MAEKRERSQSPGPEVDAEIDGDTGAIVVSKKPRTDAQLVVGSVTKEVGVLGRRSVHPAPSALCLGRLRGPAPAVPACHRCGPPACGCHGGRVRADQQQC